LRASVRIKALAREAVRSRSVRAGAEIPPT
jgi:hypothetical protein